MPEGRFQSSYGDALKSAISDLELISEEWKKLQTRGDILQSALDALAEVLQSEGHPDGPGGGPDHDWQELPQQYGTPIQDSPVSVLEHSAVPVLEHSAVPVLEPCTVAFIRGSESEQDALQRRIRHALGQAVA
jgi:hypothetical protein